MISGLLYDLVNVIPLCAVASLLVYGGMGRGFFHMESGTAALIPAIASAVICVFLGRAPMKYRAAALGVMAVAAAGAVPAMGREYLAEVLSENICVLWMMLLGVICYAAAKAAERFRPLKLVVALSALAVLIYMMVTGCHTSRLVLSAAVFYISLAMAEETEYRWKKEGKGGDVRYTVRLLPFLMLLPLFLLLFKAPEKPYSWQFVKDFLRGARIRYELLVQTLNENKSWDSEGTNMGFSEKGNLAGSLGNDPYEAVIITSDRAGDSRVYLSGKIFDSFDGRDWKKTDLSPMDYRAYDVLETAAAVMTADPGREDDYLKYETLHIEYSGIRTSRVFVPGHALYVAADPGVLSAGGDISFSGRGKPPYTVKYFRVNKSYEGFRRLCDKGSSINKDIFRVSKKLLWDKWVEKGNGDLLAPNPDEQTYEGYLDYLDRVREFYGQEMQVSERTQRLLDETTEGVTSDNEKLCMIERYLSQMKYSTAPGELPDHIRTPGDFLDYLLFESGEGYCVHYATAFVLMARSMGVPARYVQGYSTAADKKKTVIMSDCAHAWPEAHIEGVGWVAYEPTPGFKTETGWEVASETTGDKESEHEKKEGPIPEEDLPDEEEEAVLEDHAVKHRPVKIYVPVVLAAAFLLLFFTADLILRKIRYAHMDARGKVLESGRQTLKLLKKHGFSLEPGETLDELQKRAGGSVPEEMLTQIGIYETALYADHKMGEEDVNRMEDNNRELMKYVYRKKFSGSFKV
ncbi:MAG: hypothetical protein K6E33_03620 [Lachnospiraceae bacterium]|nr:hypothetical protein [Lachnospiraceae bacterium]